MKIIIHYHGTLVIYINDIDDDVSSKILKFVDDTKMIVIISSLEERTIHQTDQHKLLELNFIRGLAAIHKMHT